MGILAQRMVCVFVGALLVGARLLVRVAVGVLGGMKVVGSFIGVFVGAPVGRLIEGSLVGAADGTVVGMFVGTSSFDGLSVVGASVGIFEGLAVVGKLVGAFVGSASLMHSSLTRPRIILCSFATGQLRGVGGSAIGYWNCVDTFPPLCPHIQAGSQDNKH